MFAIRTFDAVDAAPMTETSPRTVRMKSKVSEAASFTKPLIRNPVFHCSSHMIILVTHRSL